MNTNITTQAVAAVNKQKTDALVEIVMGKMVYIGKEQEKIKGYEKAIAEFQKTLVAMADDVLKPEDVLGRGASMNPTPNEVTILEAIKKRNEEKAASIAANSKSNVATIDGFRNSIKGCEGRIADIRKEIDALTVEEVTVASVLG